MNKSLYDISWKVDEPTYRADPALSYSTLARYEREGFNNLDKLFDRIETPSLVFGSCVDTLITGNEEEFNQLFMVAELDNNISDTLVIIVKRLFETFKDKYSSLKNIPNDDVISCIEDIQWNNHWLPKTRANKIKEDCAGYYGLLYIANNRTIISTKTYNEVIKAVDALKTSDSTKFYFEPNNMFDDDIQRFYQLKFKATFNGINYRCMADEIIVFHNKKLVVPVDLKTSSKTEWDFYKSFLEWRYDIQARLYWRIIRDNMDRDPYFKDFKLAPYKFIVANKKTLTPLVWNFRSTEAMGDLTLGKITKIILRDPFKIGEELSHYLKDKPTVPDGISKVSPNQLEDWINKI
jgi:hypothetical protein